MKLEGIHHITAITGDAPRNVDFYARVLGLRMVKKTVNQDDPSVYHLFYADEHGSPGADLTFFEYPGAPLGRAGDGHGPPDRVARGLRRRARLLGTPPGRRGRRAPAATATACASPTRRGWSTSCVSSDSSDDPLIADHPEVPREHRAPGLRRRARLQLADPEAQPRPAGAGPGLHRGRRRAGSCAATTAPAGWPTTPRPPSAATRRRAPCTTWPSPRRWTTTSSGARRPPQHGARPDAR